LRLLRLLRLFCPIEHNSNHLLKAAAASGLLDLGVCAASVPDLCRDQARECDVPWPRLEQMLCVPEAAEPKKKLIVRVRDRTLSSSAIHPEHETAGHRVGSRCRPAEDKREDKRRLSTPDYRRVVQILEYAVR
jgi:hypothetical protein